VWGLYGVQTGPAYRLTAIVSTQKNCLLVDMHDHPAVPPQEIRLVSHGMEEERARKGRRRGRGRGGRRRILAALMREALRIAPMRMVEKLRCPVER
jgi:hypothetical protein